MKNTFLTLLSLILTISAIGQAKFETFIPAGWKEIARKEGDVNGDSQMNYDVSKDRAVIIEKEKSDPKGLRQTSLLVLLGTTTRENYTLYCNSDLAIPDQSAKGYSYGGMNIDRGMLLLEFSFIAADSSEIRQMNVYKLVDKQLRLIMTSQMGVSRKYIFMASHDMVEGKLVVERMELPDRKSVYKTETILKVESLPELCTYDGSARVQELYTLSRQK